MHPRVLDHLHLLPRARDGSLDPHVEAFVQAMSALLESGDSEQQMLVQAYELASTQLLAVNRDMSSILDHVAQGLVSITLDGKPTYVSSRVLERWFGRVSSDIPIETYLFPDDVERATWTRLCLESLLLGAMPTDVVLAQLRTQFPRAGRMLRVEYVPTGEPLESLLVVVTDITDELERAELDRVQREVLVLVEQDRRDRIAAGELLAAADELVDRIASGAPDTTELLGHIHTLKGMTSIYALASVAEACEAAEAEHAERSARPTDETLGRVTHAWRVLRERSRPFLARPDADVVVVARAEYESTLSVTPPGSALAARLRRWSAAPARTSLERLAEQIRVLARRLGKLEPEIEIDAGDVHVDGMRFAPVWLALVHVARNVVAHAIEPAPLRTASGRPPRTQVTLRSRASADLVELVIHDDGPGIDWAALSRRAQVRGLPGGPAALFAAGISTRDGTDITEHAGRGVGLAAVRTACEALGGTADVFSETGGGTTLRCRIPLGNVNQDEGALSCHAS